MFLHFGPDTGSRNRQIPAPVTGILNCACPRGVQARSSKQDADRYNTLNNSNGDLRWAWTHPCREIPAA